VLPGMPMMQGGRTTAQGYGAYDGIRQQFTGKERDTETGLDYFGARYYAAAQGRFTSVDPENAGADPSDPQSWNGYAYARNNPLKYTDPDGRKYRVCDPSGKNCSIISDEEFYKDRRSLEGGGLNFSGDKDFFESGSVSSNGEVQAIYHQISIDSADREFVYEMRRAFNDPELIKRAAVNAVIGAIIGGAGRRSTRSSSGRGGLTFAEMAGTLRETTKKKGNFGMGQATRQEAQVMGEAWVGPGYRVASDGKTLVSADGLKVYRPPSYKPMQSKEQANFEWRNSPGGPPTGNGHLDVQ
jgi:RHS repeat-associated protein